jgi:carboxylesterase type B
MGVSGFSWSDKHDVDSNIGLFDCLAAAQWTFEYIHKFGGDRNQITAGGQSAGAGMLYYMSGLYGGDGRLPFQQAFLSSPAVPGRRNVSSRQTELFNLVLEAAGCPDVECLRSAPEETIVEVNTKLINEAAPNGGGGNLGPVIGFGPSPDGDALPDMPLALFQEGKFHSELEGLMLGTMAAEGMGLSHDEDQPAYFPIMVRQIMSTASNQTVGEILSLYHPEFPEQLAWDWTTDVVFACNAYNLASALPQKARRYVMSTPPAVHGQDAFCKF